MRRIDSFAAAALLGAALLIAGCNSQNVVSTADSVAANPKAAATAAETAVADVMIVNPIGPRASLKLIQLRDFWGSRVKPALRVEVMSIAQRHTNWSEKREIEWEIFCFHALAMQRRNQEPPTTLPSIPKLPMLPNTLPY